MGKKHSLLKTVLAATAALYATNTAIDYHAKEKNLCSTAKGDFYDFKYGRIYYTRQGQGAPLLFLRKQRPQDWRSRYGKRSSIRRESPVLCLQVPESPNRHVR